MSYLLDTNVVSESEQSRPNPAVMDWLGARDESNVYLSALTIGEIRRGIEMLVSGKKKTHLRNWLDGIRTTFNGRILSISESTFEVWGRMFARFEKQGLKRPIFDSLLEATALEHDLILVTRNVKNFRDSSVTILNPWE
jgi:predicted nucleic acid-binding protein